MTINANDGQRRKKNHMTTIRFRLVQINDIYLLKNLPRLATFLRCHLRLPDSMCDATGKNQPYRETTSTSIETIHTTTVITVSGDFLAPSLLSSLDGGSGMVDVLHALGVTHVSLGNHEDDVPTEALRRHIEGNKFEWVNSNLRSLDEALDVCTEECCFIEIGHDGDIDKDYHGKTKTTKNKTVALLGLLSDDAGLYRPGAFGGAVEAEDGLASPLEAIERIMEGNIGGIQGADLIVPLTHLDMPGDIQLAETFGVGNNDEMNDNDGKQRLFQTIIGGHDHDVFDEVHNGCRILKAGADAHRAAVVEYEWRDVTSTDSVRVDNSNSDGSSSTRGNINKKHQPPPKVSVQWIDVKDYEPHPEVQEIVDDRRRVLHELETARLFRISETIHNMRQQSVIFQPENNNKEEEFSTRRNRYRVTAASSVFCSVIRRGLNADCCAINAGGIRGNTDYDINGWFTFADLKSEMPFPDPVAVVPVPGRVLERAVGFSRRASRRDPPEEDSGLLHLCDMVQYTYGADTEDGQIMDIGGQPFDPEVVYNVALPIALLNGMDNNAPLLEWARESGLRISEDAGKPVKIIFVETFALSFWSNLGSFEEMDLDGDGIITRNELEFAISKKLGLQGAVSRRDARYLKILVDDTMAVADVDQSGSVDLTDFLAAKLTADMRDVAPSQRKNRASLLLQRMASQELGPRRRESVLQRTIGSVKKFVRRRDSSGDDEEEDDKVEWHGSIQGRGIQGPSLKLSSMNILS